MLSDVEQSDDGGAMSDTEAAKEFVALVDKGAKVCLFYKAHLSLNEKMYPPVGYSVAPLTMNQKGLSTPSPPAFSLNGVLLHASQCPCTRSC